MLASKNTFLCCSRNLLCRALVVLCGICNLPEMFLWGVWVSEKLLMKPVTTFHDTWTMLRSSGSGSRAEEEQFWKTLKRWNNWLDLRQHPTALELSSHLDLILQRVFDRRSYVKNCFPRHWFIEKHKKLEDANYLHSFSHDKKFGESPLIEHFVWEREAAKPGLARTFQLLVIALPISYLHNPLLIS